MLVLNKKGGKKKEEREGGREKKERKRKREGKETFHLMSIKVKKMA